MCVTTEGRGSRKISLAVISPEGDLPAVVDGSRLIPPYPPSRLKWLQLDTSLDLDVNRVCKPSLSLASPSAVPCHPPETKRCADAILKAVLSSPGFQRASESLDPELHEDLATTRVYYCRASINSPLMDRSVITREGVAISSGVVSVYRRGMTNGDHRQILSRY